MAIEVGHRFPASTFLVDPLRVEEFVTALGVEPAPGYVAERGAPIPLGFLMYVTTYGAEPVHDVLQINLLKALYGGADVELFAPVRVGDELRVEPHVSNITSKEGKQGTLTFYEITCEYFLPDGTLALRERSTTIERG